MYRGFAKFSEFTEIVNENRKNWVGEYPIQLSFPLNVFTKFAEFSDKFFFFR